MTELLTAAQMRAIEQAAIASGETTGLELMERAGAGVVEAILEEWPEMALTSQKAVVLCGPGNNGGDGFVVARLLMQRGWEVEVFLYGEVEKLPPDAKVNAERWLEMGDVKDLNFKNIEKAAPYKLRVDAIFGTGLSRMPDKTIQEALSACWFIDDGQSPQFHLNRVAVECPSCIDLDSGKILRPQKQWEGDFERVFYASLTVAFHRKKVGHAIRKTRRYSGKIVVCDIGLNKCSSSSEGNFNYSSRNKWLFESPHYKGEITLLERRDFSAECDSWPAQILPKEDDHYRGKSQHKFSYGHALILSGPSAHTGAARLAARGALRIGAGVVSLGAPQSAIAECAAQLTAIMLAPIEDGVALEATLQDKRINALCLGPALGLDERAEGLLEAAIGGVEPHPTVLDADALTILARRPDLFAKLHENCVLTPHAGEFKRLFPDIMAKLEAPAATGPAYSKVDATREAAALAGCVVLFKGADTVIAAPDGRAAINSAHYERAAPWLATAGAGDVLAGFITGLLARGFAPMQAAETAAWLHVECALKFGPGLIAEDIPEQLPSVFRDLQL